MFGRRLYASVGCDQCMIVYNGGRALCIALAHVGYSDAARLQFPQKLRFGIGLAGKRRLTDPSYIICDRMRVVPADGSPFFYFNIILFGKFPSH